MQVVASLPLACCGSTSAAALGAEGGSSPFQKRHNKRLDKVGAFKRRLDKVGVDKVGVGSSLQGGIFGSSESAAAPSTRTARSLLRLFAPCPTPRMRRSSRRSSQAARGPPPCPSESHSVSPCKASESVLVRHPSKDL